MQYRKTLALFAALALALAVALAAGCASYEGPNGEEASSFGQGEVTFESVTCPRDRTADCTTTTVTVESHGFSDVFGGMFGGLVESVAGFFGRGSPPDVNITVVASEAD